MIKIKSSPQAPKINSSPLVICVHLSVSDCGISSKWPIIMPRLLIQASPELTVHFWPAGGRGGRLEVKLVSFPWNLLENISATFLSVVFGNQCTNPAVTNLTYKLLRPSIQGIGDFSNVITKSVSHELLRRWKFQTLNLANLLWLYHMRGTSPLPTYHSKTSNPDELNFKTHFCRLACTAHRITLHHTEWPSS